jgi:hypothetical protein
MTRAQNTQPVGKQGLLDIMSDNDIEMQSGKEESKYYLLPCFIHTCVYDQGVLVRLLKPYIFSLL